MPIVPGTKIWIRNEELKATCEAIEKAPPMERLTLSYDLAVATIHRQKKGMNSAKKVSDFIIKWWFNYGHLGFPLGIPYEEKR
jgi:hypothetical protein